MFVSRISYGFTQSFYDYDLHTYRNNVIDGEGSTGQLQPYTQLSWKPGNKLTVNAGLQYLYLALNKTGSAEPRASLQYKVNSNHTISVATGIYGKTLPLGSYFIKRPTIHCPTCTWT